MYLLLIIANIFFVSFVDKPEKAVPALSPRAVEQRAKWNIPTDEKDYPVSTLYLNQLKNMGVKIHHVSRWFNGATVEMSNETAEKVRLLKFVTAVDTTRDENSTHISFAKQKMPAMPWSAKENMSSYTDPQLDLFNLLPLHAAGFEGQGILMAICDGGFSGADTLSSFRQETLQLGHFDFTDDTYDFFAGGNTGTHGTACLSAISAIQENYYGAATKAQYYLMRSEENDTESPKEMDNLVAALEKADSLGVNVFSVSLGYYMFDNPLWDIDKKKLDGKTLRASQAATIAARKGMLICVAAGNEGTKEWHTIGVPADADSVLTVGAVDTYGEIGAFSSYGPSADGRIKPEVCAVGVGTTLINPAGEIYASNGTSFATPLIAGLAACLWSAYPDLTAMDIRNRIIRSADLYENPDQNQYGYGIPDAWEAYSFSPQNMEETEIHSDKPRKIIRGNEVLIVRYGYIYNLAG